MIPRPVHAFHLYPNPNCVWCVDWWGKEYDVAQADRWLAILEAIPRYPVNDG